MEALACGTPVIASNTTSLPEVVGDAGILLDPHDVTGFAAAMRRVAEDGAVAADLQEKALVQARRFTWEHTTRELARRMRACGAMSSLERCGAVVVAHARLDLARECVHSLARWLPSKRIVVVLNRPGSDPDNAAALAGIATLTSPPAPLGYGANLNFGVAALPPGTATCVLANDDVVFEPESLPRLLAVLDDDPAVGLVGRGL